MLKRDEYGIIVQHNPAIPAYGDGGDSLSRESILAMCGWEDEAKLLKGFITKSKEAVRHPMQPGFSDPKETSRDQVKCLSASTIEYENPEVQEALLKYAQGWFINKDIILFDTKLQFYKGAKAQPPRWLKILGFPHMMISLIWATKIRPDEEQNQTLCSCANYGPWWVWKLFEWHPNLLLNLYQYFCGWRDQREIYLAVNAFVLKQIEIAKAGKVSK